MNDSKEASRKDFATLEVAWEQGDVPAGRPIAVEITFTPATPDRRPDSGLPLNIGLAIDRSGSMQGGKLAAARRAAAGVLDALRDGERFAAAVFDDRVEDVTASVPLDAAARAHLRGQLAEIATGGMTALFDGFARTAELVAKGGAPSSCDSWVLVLSDGMGNRGTTDPAALRGHAAALAERGIRTISVGIGADYLADQLTALADGGAGEFHHASIPDEIVEIVLGELRGLRTVAARDLRLGVSCAGANRLLLLGGEVSARSSRTRFDRVSSGRAARAVVLVWPGEAAPSVTVDATWRNADSTLGQARCESNGAGVAGRDVELALRAARLWHAAIIARALELNERGDYEEARAWVGASQSELASYAEGLPLAEVQALLGSLDVVARRCVRRWSTLGHREAYNMTSKILRGRGELRSHAPQTLEEAMGRDEET